MIALSEVRAVLHDSVCVGVRAGYCTPGDSDHARRTQTENARRVLASDDPVVVVHDAVCGAVADRYTFPGGCPELDRHVQWIRDLWPR